MSRLMYSGLYRLKKDKVFWLFLIAVAIYEVTLPKILVDAYEYQVMENGFASLDKIVFEDAPYTGIVAVLFAALFLGREQSDGAIRGKLTVGQSRSAVFMSDFWICLIAVWSFVVLWLMSCAAACIAVGELDMGITGFIIYALSALAFTAAITAAAVLVGHLITNKAFLAVAAAAVWVLLIIVASGLNDRLNVPETTGGMAYLDGEFVMMEPEPNPLYLTGTARTVCETVLRLLPTGQAILMNNADLPVSPANILYSLAFTAVMLGSGLMLFKRKDIK